MSTFYADLEKYVSIPKKYLKVQKYKKVLFYHSTKTFKIVWGHLAFSGLTTRKYADANVKPSNGGVASLNFKFLLKEYVPLKAKRT